MAELFIAYDTGMPVGQRLSAEVIAEIQAIAPSNVANGSITTAKLATDAVTAAKIADDAVESAHLATGAVDTAALASDSVTAVKIPNGAITMAKLGTGRVQGANSTGAQSLTIWTGTAAQYAALAPDASTVYLIS